MARASRRRRCALTSPPAPTSCFVCAWASIWIQVCSEKASRSPESVKSAVPAKCLRRSWPLVQATAMTGRPARGRSMICADMRPRRMGSISMAKAPGQSSAAHRNSGAMRSMLADEVCRGNPGRGDDGEFVGVVDAGGILEPVGKDAEAVALGAGRTADEAGGKDVIVSIAESLRGDPCGFEAGRADVGRREFDGPERHDQDAGGGIVRGDVEALRRVVGAQGLVERNGGAQSRFDCVTLDRSERRGRRNSRRCRKRRGR